MSESRFVNLSKPMHFLVRQAFLLAALSSPARWAAWAGALLSLFLALCPGETVHPAEQLSQSSPDSLFSTGSSGNPEMLPHSTE